MTDLASLLTIDIGQPDDRIIVHPTLWNALVAEVIAWRADADHLAPNDDLASDSGTEAFWAEESRLSDDADAARATTDAALKERG